MTKWKDIQGYEGLYQVSNTALIKSLDRLDRRGRRWYVKILQASPSSHGYLMVRLSKNGKQRSFGVHRLVALHFVEGFEPGLVVDHNDTDILNNLPSNLEWITSKENVRRGILTKLKS